MLTGQSGGPLGHASSLVSQNSMNDSSVGVEGAKHCEGPFRRAQFVKAQIFGGTSKLCLCRLIRHPAPGKTVQRTDKNSCNDFIHHQQNNTFSYKNVTHSAIEFILNRHSWEVKTCDPLG